MLAYFIYFYIVTERCLELIWAESNTKKLVRRGAKEFFSGHYKWIVIFHVLWFIFLLSNLRPNLPIWGIPFIIFVCLQFCRFWVLITLGNRWTTKIIRFPGERPISHGPYRWIRHPNYVVVAGEILIVPLMFGLWEYALLGSVIHALVIIHRIRKENRTWQIDF